MRTRSGTSGGEVVGVLDVGTSKVGCAIALLGAAPDEPGGRRAVRILGHGQVRSRGVKAGTIVDLAEAEGAIRAAVAQAERGTGITLEQVHVAVACGRLHSEKFIAKTRLDQVVAGGTDIERVLAGGRDYAGRDGRALVHLERLGFRLDGTLTVRDPRGLAGTELAAELVAVTADAPALRNLLAVIDRCHLAPLCLVPSPYAGALAVLDSEERRLGALCIDLGGGTTMLAGFRDGRLVHIDGIAVGGSHITYDIARQLATPVAEAERIKTLYGTMLEATSDKHDLVTYPQLGAAGGMNGSAGDAVAQVSRARLRQLIGQRVDGWMELVRERIERSGLADSAGRRIVVTGGAGQLVGLTDHLARYWGCDVRLGVPARIDGAAGRVQGPDGATLIGLLEVARRPADALLRRPGVGGREVRGLLGRMRAWVRDSF